MPADIITQLIKSWKINDTEIIAVLENNQIYFTITTAEGKYNIPYADTNIPIDLLKDTTKLTHYLTDSYVRLSKLDNGNYKIYINQQGNGGANIIDAVNEPEKLWPKGIVPFEIDSTVYPPGSKKRAIILTAIKEWNKSNTQMTLQPRGLQRDYVVFGNATNICYSTHVGRNPAGGPQYIQCDLNPNRFTKGNILHEIGHAIGFHHEQQRKDRSKYVTVKGGRAADYVIQGTAFGQYDVKSLMHYPFNNNLQPKPGLPDAEKAGNRKGLTPTDKLAAKYLASKSHGQNVPNNPTININSNRYTFHKPPEWQTLKEKGDRHFAIEDHLQAFCYYNTLLEEYSTCLSDEFKAKIYNLCGVCAYKNNEYETAHIMFSQACSLTPRNPVYLQNLSEAESLANYEHEYVSYTR